MEFIFYINLIILMVGCGSTEEYIDVNVDKFLRKIDEDILYSTACKYDVTTDVLDKKKNRLTNDVDRPISSHTRLPVNRDYTRLQAQKPVVRNTGF